MNLLWRMEAERILTRFCEKYPIRQYSTFDFGREKNEDAVSVILPELDAFHLLPEIREELAPGLVAFVGTTRWLGDERHDGVELVIAPGESQFDMLLVARSCAINFGMTTGDLIQKLQEYDRLCGIDIVQAESDTIQFDLLDLPDDVAAFVEDLYHFCPDLGGYVGSIQETVDDIVKSRRIELWWD